MKSVLLLISLLLLVSCIQEVKENEVFESYEYKELNVESAKGFELNYSEDYLTIITKSVEGNTHFRDSLVIITNPNFLFNKDVKVFNGIVNTVAVQSSTHLSYIQNLEAIQSVAGVCGLAYLVNQEAQEDFSQREVSEICNSDQMSKEVLLGLNPNLIFSYPFGTSGVETFEEIGLKSIMIAEYLETDVIARLEWIKLFGILYKKEEAANNYFEEVKTEYENLMFESLETPEEKKFIMNLPFEDNWYMPAPNSLIVNLFKDAGLAYYYSDREGTENVLLPQEQVWLDGSKADIWIIIAQREGDFTKEELLLENPVYAEFKSFKENNIYFCNTLTKDYFGMGIMEPHILLKDILYLKGDISDHTPVYFERLK